jgi:NADH dehydrogenase
MKIFITGSSGFIGKAVVEQLVKQNYEVIAAIRAASSKKLPAQKPDNVTYVNVDLYDVQSIIRACNESDAIIHLVGIISEVGSQTFQKVHVEITKNIVSAAKACKIKRLLHMSALGTRANAPSRYHQSKYEAEGLIRNSTLEYTIFRPSIVYGPGDKFINLFAKLAKLSPVILIPGNGKARLQPIKVELVAQAFVNALTESKASFKTFELVGPEVFSLNEIIQLILKAINRKRIVVHLPEFLAFWVARSFEIIFPRIFSKPPPLNTDQLLMLAEDNTGDPTPANNILRLIQPGSFYNEIRNQLGLSAY